MILRWLFQGLQRAKWMSNNHKRIKEKNKKLWNKIGRNETRTGEYDKELIINLRIEKYIY